VGCAFWRAQVLLLILHSIDLQCNPGMGERVEPEVVPSRRGAAAADFTSVTFTGIEEA